MMGPAPAEGHQNNQSPINMNTSEITAADVVAFLTAEAAKLAKDVGHEFSFVGCYIGNPAYSQPVKIEWKAYTPASGHITADNLGEVIETTLTAAAPENCAKRKREEAAKLLAEADALVPQPVEAT
jgi:hypothetical protein